MLGSPPLNPNAELSLAVAMITSSVAPLLLLDGDLVVVVASASFCQSFHIEPAEVAGHKLFDLGQGEWASPQMRSLLENIAAGSAEVDAYEMDFNAPGHPPRRLVLNANRLVYGGAAVRVLVAVTDVTNARASEKQKDDLIREKAMLLQEVQHRVANSLQIIASVLLQNARNVQSEETRVHLRDAHQRVMSVAALQQQLAASTLDDVVLKPYFTQLCKSIGASMIHDHAQLSIEVIGDDSVTTSDTSVSLGLIVTELVINALKHAFPDQRVGKIIVGYQGQGANWSLRVSDNGVGMSNDATVTKAGLGTSIVQALAVQLGAKVLVGPGHPGTLVSIVRSHLTAIDGGAAAAV